MNKIRLTVNSTIGDFTYKNSLTSVLTLECYFQESVRIAQFLDSIKTDNKEFIQLISNFKSLYKVYYELNKEIPLKLGGTTYISLEII